MKGDSVMQSYLLEFKKTGDAIIDDYRNPSHHDSAVAYIADVTEDIKDLPQKGFSRIYYAVTGNNQSLFKIEIENRGYVYFEPIGEIFIHFTATVQAEILSGILLACSYIEDTVHSNDETAPPEYFESEFLRKYALRELDIDGEDYEYEKYKKIIIDYLNKEE